jgi:hypothetical protein
LRILADGECLTALFVDESFGGIGVLLEMADGARLRIGDSVVVLQNDYPTPGKVQWLRHDPEINRIRAGIRWSS